VRFAATGQQTATTLGAGLLHHRWPALAVLRCFDQLDADTQQVARSVLTANADLILDYYRNANYNLWEEVFGQSFFTRSVRLKCLLDVQANRLGVATPSGVGDQPMERHRRLLHLGSGGEEPAARLRPETSTS